MAVDPFDGSLWGASEGLDQIVHYDVVGNLISVIPNSAFDPNAETLEGVDVSSLDGTLWVVDDTTLLVYNIETDGTLISSFPTSTFDPTALSPQDIAYDSSQNTLWLSDNSSDTIYNITPTGQLLSSFPTSTYGASVSNPQGVAVEPGGATLWLTSRKTSSVFNVTTAGALISMFSTGNAGAHNPTGVALVAPGTPPASFCTAKTVVFCGPSMLSAAGTPSATLPGGFVLSASPARGCRSGILLYSNHPVQTGVPFGGPGDGLLCLFPSGLRRAGPIDSGGTDPSTCDGVLSIDLNSFAQNLWAASGCNPAPGQNNPAGYLTNPGTAIHAQMWGRDSVETGQLLSDGLSWVVCP